MTDYSDVPHDVISSVRAACADLPESVEEQAWTGRRWRIRKRTFGHVFTVDSERRPVTILTFRSSEPELHALRQHGHPFFRPGWGTNTVGMVIDDDVDWDEVRELLTESYLIMAPKKLAARVLGQ